MTNYNHHTTIALALLFVISLWTFDRFHQSNQLLRIVEDGSKLRGKENPRPLQVDKAEFAHLAHSDGDAATDPRFRGPNDFSNNARADLSSNDRTGYPLGKYDLKQFQTLLDGVAPAGCGPKGRGAQNNGLRADDEPPQDELFVQPPRKLKWCKCSDAQLEMIRVARMPKPEEDHWRVRRENQLLYEQNRLPGETLPSREQVEHRKCPCKSDGDRSLTKDWVDACVRLGLVSQADKPNLESPKHEKILDICDPLAVLDPGSPPPNTPTRVAHCLTGSVRFPGYLQVPFLYNQTVIKTLDAPSDIFIVLDATTEDLNSVQRYDIQQKTKLLYGATEVEFLTREMWDDSPHWAKSTLFNRFHNVAQFFKKDVCYRMMRMYEAKNNIRYTHVVNGRPDLILPLGYGPIHKYSNDAIATAQYGEERDINKPDTPPWTVVLPGPEYLAERHHGWNEVVTDITQVMPVKFAHRFYRQVLNLMIRDIEAPGEDVTGDRVQFIFYRENGLDEKVNRHSITYKMFRHMDRCNDPNAFKWNDWCI